jgi:hypothetical protein
MFKLRLFDPVGLAGKEKELRDLRQKIEDLEDRELELREEKRQHAKRMKQRKVANAL